MPGIVTKYRGLGDDLSLVDMHAALNTTTDLSDGVHPTAAGFQKMADTWYAAVAPEPSAMALLGAGAGLLLGRRRRAKA
jgi:PEP-CTERM motif-containing protein